VPREADPNKSTLAMTLTRLRRKNATCST
jgi:hypothetical protein